jgi:hypothetical protein
LPRAAWASKRRMKVDRLTVGFSVAGSLMSLARASEEWRTKPVWSEEAAQKDNRGCVCVCVTDQDRTFATGDNSCGVLCCRLALSQATALHTSSHLILPIALSVVSVFIFHFRDFKA